MSKITFLASENTNFRNILHYHQEIDFAINYSYDDIIVSDLSFMCFDLFDKGFSEINLFYCGEFYELKLGSNTWTTKELRKEHNLLKLVKSNIL